jgi:hypothetical protein
MSVPTIARRLLEATAGEHPVISAVFDLDPSQFATAPARATQAASLIDAGHNLEKADETLNHDARQAVRSDLERLDSYLGSADFPVNRAGALAIYVSAGDDLFETVVLSRPARSRAARAAAGGRGRCSRRPPSAGAPCSSPSAT